MHAGKFLYATLFLIVFITTNACAPTPTPVPQKDIEIEQITENKEVRGQISQVKFFDQCAAAGSVEASIQFSRSSSESSQQELVLSGSVGAEAGVSVAAKAEAQISIEKHFSSVSTVEEDYQEAIRITIPPRTRQEYTITWQEIRREGTIEYVEAGEKKSANYSYRIGLEFVSTVAREISCDSTLTPSPEPPTQTPDISDTATPSPVILPISAGCISSQTWNIDSTDQSQLSGIAIRANGCYDTSALGIFPDQNGVLHILDEKKRQQLASGIFTELNNDSVIEFQVHVNLIYLVNPGNPVYINFAVAPAGDPMTTKNTARFKLQVEDTIHSPLIYFVLADVGENNGSKIPTQHYEYGRTYTIRLELTGGVMGVYINNIRQNENLAIPTGPKVFYIGYSLPTLAGVDVEVTNIKIDGVLK